MNSKAVAWALSQDVPRGRKAVLLAMAHSANASMATWLDRNEISRNTGHKPTTVRNLQNALAKTGHLVVVPWQTDAGGDVTPGYFLGCARSASGALPAIAVAFRDRPDGRPRGFTPSWWDGGPAVPPRVEEESAEVRTVVYRLYDEVGDPVYIGSSMQPEVRFKQHQRNAAWWSEVAAYSLTWYPSRGAAEVAETLAIALERPLYNVRGTDDVVLSAHVCSTVLHVVKRALADGSSGVPAEAVETVLRLVSQAIDADEQHAAMALTRLDTDAFQEAGATRFAPIAATHVLPESEAQPVTGV